MRRVAVIGCGGAGKTTLARRLGEALGSPVIHGDLHHVAREQVRGELIARADTVVFVDPAPLTCPSC